MTIVLTAIFISTRTAFTSLTPNNELYMSTTEWTDFLKYLVTKSRRLLKLLGREFNPKPSITKELVLNYMGPDKVLNNNCSD